MTSAIRSQPQSERAYPPKFGNYSSYILVESVNPGKHIPLIHFAGPLCTPSML